MHSFVHHHFNVEAGKGGANFNYFINVLGSIKFYLNL